MTISLYSGQLSGLEKCQRNVLKNISSFSSFLFSLNSLQRQVYCSVEYNQSVMTLQMVTLSVFFNSECLWPLVLLQWHWLPLFSVGFSLDMRLSTVTSSLFLPLLPDVSCQHESQSDKPRSVPRTQSGAGQGLGEPPLMAALDQLWLPTVPPRLLCLAALVSLWVTVYSDVSIKIIPLFFVLIIGLLFYTVLLSF